MVIFHSYVSLPEGRWVVATSWDDISWIMVDMLGKSWGYKFLYDPHDSDTIPNKSVSLTGCILKMGTSTFG
jgi:hypothetical protein